MNKFLKKMRIELGFLKPNEARHKGLLTVMRHPSKKLTYQSWLDVDKDAAEKYLEYIGYNNYSLYLRWNEDTREWTEITTW